MTLQPPYPRVDETLPPRVAPLIAALYERAAATAPDAENPIAPLSRLTSANALSTIEIDGLTRRAATQYLVDRGFLKQRASEETSAEFDRLLAGFFGADASGAWVFVNKRDSVAQRRWVVAHALGHFVLHWPLLREREVQWSDALPIDEGAPDVDMAAESEADCFAAQLLMPSELVHHLTAQSRAHFGDEDLVWRLSDELLVSRAALRHRLQDLGWLAAS